MVGREVKVLIEKPGKFDGQMVGKSEYLHAVHINDCSARVGDLVAVKIVAAMRNSLSGELL
jgi:tRNA-2-methylthio-N6-dimethylallyladenosine synthase